MRALFALPILLLTALPLRADTEAARLFDAMGIPGLVAAFAEDGIESANDLNDGFLNGQGGDVFAEAVRQLHDPARIEEELRAAMIATLSPDDARQALVFFESDQGHRIVELEVEARRAMVAAEVEAAAKVNA